MDGSHSIEDCFNASERSLKSLFHNLKESGVNIKGTLLKPSMVTSGSDADVQASIKEVAEKTLECLKKNVPSNVTGIAFLSGGQSEIEASKNLNEINKINDTSFHFTFSYGRALQQSALKTWAKSMKDTAKIQKVFDHRAKMNSLATLGKWESELEK